MFPTQDLHVKELVRLSTPRALKAELPTTEASNVTVVRGREAITRILRQEDTRLLVIIDGILPLDPILDGLKTLAAEGLPTRIQVKVEFLSGVPALGPAAIGAILSIGAFLLLALQSRSIDRGLR